MRRLKKLFFRTVLRQLEEHKSQQACMMRVLTDSNFRIRAMLKQAQKQPINVLFVCHCPALWSMFDSIYQSMILDPDFNPLVISMHYKHMSLPAGIFKDDGMLEFCKERNINTVRGYISEESRWLSPESLHPDYVFFQTPYDLFPTEWAVEHVSMIARVCYLSYGPTMSKGKIAEIVQPERFFRHVSLFFAECDFKRELFENKFKHSNWFKRDRIIVTGYPKTDHFSKPSIEENNLSWKREVSDRTTRILWSPRWSSDEGLCHFFDYKDYFSDFCRTHDEIDFVFRPHPLFWQNFEKTGELTGEQQKQLKSEYENSPNMAIDSNGSCEDTFRTCDILVSDFSSMMIEFYPAGKPIIYTHRKDVFNEYAARMAEGVYWVNNEHELSETLSMLLSGEDPLRKKREQLMESLYYMPECSVGELIQKSLKNDFVNS